MAKLYLFYLTHYILSYINTYSKDIVQHCRLRLYASVMEESIPSMVVKNLGVELNRTGFNSLAVPCISYVILADFLNLSKLIFPSIK